MPHTKCTDVYYFSELGDTAKERARDWYRKHALDYDWWRSVYSDAADAAAYLGIDLHRKPTRLMSGKIRYDLAIYFSGFCSQGDGACTEHFAQTHESTLKSQPTLSIQATTLTHGAWIIGMNLVAMRTGLTSERPKRP